MSSKFTVTELAKMMAKPPKEVLFLLQGIGVDVKTIDSVLDPSTAQAILTGKTQAPKTLIVRQAAVSPAPAPAALKPKPERAALKRIKIVERPPGEAGPEAATGTEAAADAVESVVVVEAAEPLPAPAPAAVEAAEAVPAPEPAPAPEPRAVAAPEPPATPAPAPEPEPAVAAEPAPEPVAVTEPVAAAPAETAPPAAAAPPEAPVAAAAAAPAAPAAAAHPARPAAHPHPRKAAGTGTVSASPRSAGVSRPVDKPRSSAARPSEAAHRAPAAAPKPASPVGALGRIQRRAAEMATRPPSPPPPAAVHQVETPTGASAGPHSPGVSQMRTPPPAAPPPAGAAGAAAPVPAPPRGAGNLGRAVIAPPSAATMRSVRAATAMSTPAAARPAAPVPSRPVGGQMLRPGAPRPAGPGLGRPMLGRPAMAAPPPGPVPVDKRRKDAGKPTTAKKDDAKKTASKKPRTKEVSALEENVREYLGTFHADTYEDVTTQAVELDEDGNPIIRPLSKSAQRRAAKKTIETETGEVVEVRRNSASGPVFLSEGVTVKELSEKIGILAKDVVKSLLTRGILATINQSIEPTMAVEIAREFGIDAAIVSFEEELELSRQQAASDPGAAPSAAEGAAGKPVPRAPVVTVMGHVDHGKTSLLDAIRHANVAEGEAGGITQHIGAYRVEVNGRKIVFLDTPGHEAFTMMRARGAKATDIVILVVAADDGVMPQTVEAIDHARAAKVPLVVAINKIDKPEANPGRVKQALAEKGVVVEDFGGEVVSCEISAKKRVGIEQLLEMVLLQADILELKAAADVPARGVVLESRREVGRGSVATVLVQQGTLKVGDVFFAGSAVGRVRAMLDDRAQRIDQALPATPVEVMGFEDLPDAGDTLQVVEDEQKARQVVGFRAQKEREEALAKSTKKSLSTLFDRLAKGEAKELSVILKADVHGSEEVLLQTLQKLSTDKVKVSVLHSGVGAITVNDVSLASASEAIVIGFNVRPERKAMELAEKEGIDVRLYSVIYNVTDEMKKAMAGLLDLVKKEAARGRAEVRETFKVPKVGVVAGCMVLDGLIPRGASVRLVRDSRVIYEGKIGSLRRFKDDASEVKSGFECGIGIAGYQDVKVGDIIEAFVLEEVAPTL